MFINGAGRDEIILLKSESTQFSIYDLQGNYTISCRGVGIISIYLFAEYGKSATVHIYGTNIKLFSQGDIKIHQFPQKFH